MRLPLMLILPTGFPFPLVLRKGAQGQSGQQ